MTTITRYTAAAATARAAVATQAAQDAADAVAPDAPEPHYVLEAQAAHNYAALQHSLMARRTGSDVHAEAAAAHRDAADADTHRGMREATARAMHHGQ